MVIYTSCRIASICSWYWIETPVCLTLSQQHDSDAYGSAEIRKQTWRQGSDSSGRCPSSLFRASRVGRMASSSSPLPRVQLLSDQLRIIALKVYINGSHLRGHCCSCTEHHHPPNNCGHQVRRETCVHCPSIQRRQRDPTANAPCIAH